jgi:hypothetical protein
MGASSGFVIVIAARESSSMLLASRMGRANRVDVCKKNFSEIVVGRMDVRGLSRLANMQLGIT